MLSTAVIKQASIGTVNETFTEGGLILSLKFVLFWFNFKSKYHKEGD